MTGVPEASPHPSRARWGAWLVAAAFALLQLVWAMTTPAAGFPDELDHYVRALSVGRGELLGEPSTDELERAPEPEDKTCCVPGNPTATRWVALGARIVEIPADLAPANLDCREARLRAPSLCEISEDADGAVEHRTAMGTLEPFPYVLPGLATHVTSDPDVALRLARLANATLSALLVGAAVLALWPRPGERSVGPLAGILLAVTPMVLYVGASASPSALEITAGLAFFALLLRLVRDDGGGRLVDGSAGDDGDRPGWRVWAPLAVAGAVLATSRSLGPVWILLDVVLVVGLVGVRATWARVRDGGRAAWIAIGVVTAAALSTVAWEATNQPGVDVDRDFLRDQIGPASDELQRVLDEVVGVFGAIDVRQPDRSYVAWIAGLVVLGVLTLAVGRWRHRLLVVLQWAALVAATLLLAAAVLRQSGFDVQGRHVLALAVSAPLLAGDVLRRQSGRHGVAARGAIVGVTAVVAVVTTAVHVTAVLRAGDVYGWLDEGATAWAPPGGAGLWVALTVVAGLCLLSGVALALVGAVRDRPPPADTALA